MCEVNIADIGVWAFVVVFTAFVIYMVVKHGDPV